MKMGVNFCPPKVLNQQKTALPQTLGMSLESRLIVTMLNYDDDPIKVCESTKQGQNPPQRIHSSG